ncbi:hypothetical protein H4Q26_009881 [Puccinia striiformis f. sp. tritici PST-130]|nr:hypothetical protein H4Q26_009881 [Puccinia striiformis f. sp. tritici PST-130]
MGKIGKDSIDKTVWASHFIDENKLLELLRDDGVFMEIEKDFKAKVAKAIGGAKKKESLKSVLEPRVRQELVGLLNRHKTDSEEDLSLLHAADRFLVDFFYLDANTNQFNNATQALQKAQHFSGLLNLILLLGNS